MKAIKDINKWPKFLVVNGVPETRSYNRFLLKPWKKGEMVKVAPFEEQLPNRTHEDSLKFAYPITDARFRSNYVKVYRKDNAGSWTLSYVEKWESFDLLNNKKITK